MLCLICKNKKKPIYRELNLEGTLDEDIELFPIYFLFCSTGPDAVSRNSNLHQGPWESLSFVNPWHVL